MNETIELIECYIATCVRCGFKTRAEATRSEAWLALEWHEGGCNVVRD